MDNLVQTKVTLARRASVMPTDFLYCLLPQTQSLMFLPSTTTEHQLQPALSTPCFLWIQWTIPSRPPLIHCHCVPVPNLVRQHSSTPEGHSCQKTRETAIRPSLISLFFQTQSLMLLSSSTTEDQLQTHSTMPMSPTDLATHLMPSIPFFSLHPNMQHLQAFFFFS